MNGLKKEEGMLFNVVVPICFIILACTIILYINSIKKVYSARDDIENSLAAATLAGDIADCNLYGSSRIINIDNPKKSYELFKSSLKQNLYLDDKFYPINKDSMVKSNIRIESYIIYNVVGNNIEENRVVSGTVNKYNHLNAVGKLKTPRGDVIKNTTIYSKIGFSIGGFMSINNDKAFKECVVDLTDKE